MTEATTAPESIKPPVEDLTAIINEKIKRLFGENEDGKYLLNHWVNFYLLRAPVVNREAWMTYYREGQNSFVRDLHAILNPIAAPAPKKD